jgi:hypothetical protein
MTTTLKAHLKKQIEEAKDGYLKDLEAMPEEALGTCPGGSARTPYDFTYEVATVHKRIVARLKGEDPGPWPGANGWMKAPEEFQSKAFAMKEIRDTADAVLSALEEVPDHEMERRIALPNSETSPLDLASLAAVHLVYHDAQLNYLQSMGGDDKLHWDA